MEELNVGPKVVPEELKDEQVLFLTDILPTSLWGTEIANVKSGDTVAVLGCGPVGLLTIKWCIKKGASRIIAVDRVGYRLQHAKNYGVEVLNFEEYEEVGAYIKEITSGGVDSVIDCVGLNGKMSLMEKVETALKLQGGSKSATDIITHTLPLEKGRHAYEIFDAKEDNCIKVVLKP